MKRLLGASLTLLLAISGISPAYAQGTEPMLIPLENDEALFVLSEDDILMMGSWIALQPDAPDENLKRAPWIECDSIDDPKCDLNKRGYSGFAHLTLPACQSALEEDCVAAFGLELNGVYYPGQFERAVAIRGTTQAKPSINLYRGGSPSLFRVPEVPHDKGDLYLVMPRSTLNENRGKFYTSEFYLNVIPVGFEPANYRESMPKAMPCIWATETECAVRGQFNMESKPVVEIRATNEVGGWFLGRMKDPTLQVTQFSRRNNTIKVSASPVQVARFAHKMKKKDVTFADRKAAGNTGATGDFNSEGPIRIFNDGFDTSNFGFLKHFRPKTNDTAVGATTIFQMRTSSRDSGNACLNDKSKVLGLVTTNSMVYDGFAPRFSKGFLDYRVAGLHYESDGTTEVIGSYDLVMRSETARCLYNFSKAPVSATITITGEGDKNIATTVVGERNGWLKLAAYGFTFSKKTIKVKLTQKRTTITCVSTTTPVKTRKVSGFSPKCPSGFKKQ